MNVKKWYVLAALIVTAPTVQASVQPQVRALVDQAVSVATFTQLANTLKPLGAMATQLPGQIKQNIQNKYGVDVATIVAMDPAKINALALLEEALTNYQTSHSIDDAEEVVNQAMTVGNENLILKIFGPLVKTTIKDAKATIAGHTATTRTVAATVPGAENDLRHVATYLAEIEPTNGANQVEPADDIVALGTKAQLLVNDVNQDIMTAKFYLDDLRLPTRLRSNNDRPFAPAVANGGPLETTIKEIFAKQVQDMMQPQPPTTLQQIAHLTGIPNSLGANPGTVPDLLDPTITPDPNDFEAIKNEANFFTQYMGHALISTDDELERVAGNLVPTFALLPNDTLVNRTTALLNHLASQGARSATLDAYLNGLKPHGTTLITSCGLDSAKNATGNTAQIITDVCNALGYTPVDQAAGIKAMSHILQSLNLDYIGLTTTDEKVDYVIKKLLFDQYKTFMWLTKDSGTPGTNYPGTAATAGVATIAEARITQLNNALNALHAAAGGTVLPTGQDHQLVTLGNSLQTALNTKLTSCTTSNLFLTSTAVNVPNLVIAVNEMKDVITTLAPAGTPTAAGDTAQLVEAIKKKILLPLVTRYIDANNIASSFIDFTEINAVTPNRHTTIQNNIKEMVWTLQSLAHAAKLSNGIIPVPEPAAFDATTYVGIPSIPAGDKLNKATLVQDIVNGIKATVVTAPAGTSTLKAKYDYAKKMYTGRSGLITINTNTFDSSTNYAAGLEDIHTLFSGVMMNDLPVPFNTTWDDNTFANEMREVSGGTIVLLRTIDAAATHLGLSGLTASSSYVSFGALMKAAQDKVGEIAIKAAATGAVLPPEVMQHNEYVDSLKVILNFRNSIKPLMSSDSSTEVTVTTTICNNAPLLFTPSTTNPGPGKYDLTETGKFLLNLTSTTNINPPTLKLLFKSLAIKLLPTIQVLQTEAANLTTKYHGATSNIKKFKLESSGSDWSIPTPITTTTVPDNLDITIINE